jgi:hypothetical protein
VAGSDRPLTAIVSFPKETSSIIELKSGELDFPEKAIGSRINFLSVDSALEVFECGKSKLDVK